MKTIMFVTDSLGLPRTFPEVISEKDVWVTKVCGSLDKAYPGKLEYQRLSRYGLHSRSTIRLVKKFFKKNTTPDIVVVQIGIVDACPRALRKLELTILSKIPIINKVARAIIKRNYAKLTIKRKIEYVPINEFEHHMGCLRDLLPACSFLIIPIAPVNSSFAKKSPRVKENVNAYNQSLLRIFGDDFLVGGYDGANMGELFLSDDHHLSCYGNEFLSKTVTEGLRERLL